MLEQEQNQAPTVKTPVDKDFQDMIEQHTAEYNYSDGDAQMAVILRKLDKKKEEENKSKEFGSANSRKEQADPASTLNEQCNIDNADDLDELLNKLAMNNGLKEAYTSLEKQTKIQRLDLLEDFTMTLDPITTNIFSNASDKSYKKIISIQEKYGIQISCSDLDDGNTDADVILDPWNRSVFFGFCTLFVNGITRFTASMVLQGMSGGRRNNHTDSKIMISVADSLERMRHTNLSIVWNDILHTAGHDLKDGDVYKSTRQVLPLEKYKGNLANGRSADIYHVTRIPDLLKFAFIKKQITTIDADYIQLDKHAQARDYIIRDYLLERIMHWRNKTNRNASGTILIKTIFKECLPEYPSPSEEKKIRVQIFNMLDGFTKAGLISGYEKHRKGRRLISVKVF